MAFPPPAGLRPSLERGQQQQTRSTAKSLQFARGKSAGGYFFGQIHFSGDAATLTGNVKKCYRSENAPTKPETLRVRFPSGSESGDNARAGDRDAMCLHPTGNSGRGKKHAASPSNDNIQNIVNQADHLELTFRYNQD
jgi:hypothetical protein